MKKLDQAKINITNAIEQRIAELTKNTALEAQVRSSEILGNLSEEQLIRLKSQKFEQELSNKLTEKRLDVLKETVSKLDGLMVSEKETLAIAKKIGELNEKDAQDKEIIKKIVDKLSERAYDEQLIGLPSFS